MENSFGRYLFKSWARTRLFPRETIMLKTKQNVKKENISVDKNAELPNKDLNVGLQKFTQICVGSNQPSSEYSSHFVVAGISVDEFSLSKVNFENCFEATGKLSLLDWELYNVSKELFSVEDLCIDTYVISYINKSGSYSDHHQMCKHLNGRFISEDEIKHFEKYFIAFWETVREESYSDEIGLWLPGGNTKAMTLKSICYFFYFDAYANENSTQGSSEVPCIVDMISTVCISPAYTDFTFYGALKKYDTNYFLKGENFSFYLEGDELSYIKMKNDKWVLGSELHRETCETKRALPVGRNKWEIKNENVSKILTFTHCNRSEFACTNGECLPWYYRCNGVVECTDKTDEELCQPIRKEKGYVVERTPPSRKHESKFKIFYFTLIFNIADITSEKGIAVVDVLISLSWYDPRINFWNPVKDQKIICHEIWSPFLSMADNARSGFQISFESYRSSCQIFTSGQEKDIKRKYSFTDPYMGTFVKGKDMKITYVFSGLVTVPCRFNLRKYPFGTQTCNISFWADNAYLTKQYEFVHDDGKYKDYTTYEGRKDLGEYLFISDDDVIEKSYFVTIIIKLKNLYGFHMLNSFAPSFLICVITFGTLFFPITYFSERVSISLTALLVLAALFTQASDKSVITPYFKLLDIWFVVLIFYCFMIVIYNIALNKVMILEERKAKKAALRSKQDYQTGNDEFEILVLSE
ncbi:Gamma-aminobutyric acid receptor subunit beta-1, partial [Armadillidium vulgare]